MVHQYWVGDFFIDLSRNQITRNQQSQTLAPKVLAVLTCLAEHQGKVVSQHELLSQVWPDTVVSPNTLQRYIAVLRKVLNDDGKQDFIKTHARKGYSLEQRVQWSDNNHQESSLTVTVPVNTEAVCPKGGVDNANTKYDVDTSNSKNSTLNKILIFVVAVIIATGILVHQLYIKNQSTPFTVNEIRSITQTDHNESAGIYSPDGQYVVFQRYTDIYCVNNIWAKSAKTQQEFQLTKELGTFGPHSFSEDSKKLAFIQTNDCSKPIMQKKCYKLMYLDFDKALEFPQLPHELIECLNSEIRMPKWLNNNNLVLLQRAAERWELISYSISNNKSQILYKINDGNIIYYDYSSKDHIFALTTIRNDGYHYIEILKADGQLISSHRIKYPKDIANFELIYPKFSSSKGKLIFSTGRQLFTLSFEGRIEPISLPLDEPIWSPEFHPYDTKILATKGHYDSDVVSLPLSQFKSTSMSNKDKPYNVLDRSIVAEDFAKFQPNGKLIAFESKRSGEEQLWVNDGKRSHQLSHFPIDTKLHGINWGKEGKSILVNANKALKQVFLERREKHFTFSYPIEKLFQWNSEKNTALSIVKINGVSKFAELELDKLKVNIINDKQINWAFESETNELIYTDHLYRFWRAGPIEDLLISALDDQGSDKGFLIKNNVIYGINEDYWLWSYNLKTENFTLIRKVPYSVTFLTDINQTEVLMTIKISTKKEVVELMIKE